MSNSQDTYVYELANDKDIDAIIDLQKRNTIHANPEEHIEKEGYVTVVHDPHLLKSMNAPHPHIICKVNDILCGYALVMLCDFKNNIEILKPMFDIINSELETRGKRNNYFVMGQICIDKDHRGKGVFKGLYDKMINVMAPYFDLVITEISDKNRRSLDAHLHCGFTILTKYSTPKDNWVIVERKIT